MPIKMLKFLLTLAVKEHLTVKEIYDAADEADMTEDEMDVVTQVVFDLELYS